MLTREGFLLQMDGHHMFVECRVLPEGLVARRVLCAPILISPIMCCKMPSQPRSSHKGFPAPLPVTDVISDRAMGTFNMMLEMGRSEECLLTIILGAFKNPFVVVGAKMLLQSSRSIERFGTALKWAKMSL